MYIALKPSDENNSEKLVMYRFCTLLYTHVFTSKFSPHRFLLLLFWQHKQGMEQQFQH